jgi:hypothetical protein
MPTVSAVPAPWRSRIVGHGEEDPTLLLANPANWRTHPPRQREALHRRYPEGPEQMRREGLDGRANITGMHPPTKDTAA